MFSGKQRVWRMDVARLSGRGTEMCGSHSNTDSTLWTLRWEIQLHRNKKCGVGERRTGLETIQRWPMRTSSMIVHHTAKPEACYSK